MSLMSKEARINVRTTEDIKRELEITARLRGITVSALVNSQVVKAIREEKEREPSAFAQKTVPGKQVRKPVTIRFNRHEEKPVENPSENAIENPDKKKIA